MKVDKEMMDEFAKEIGKISIELKATVDQIIKHKMEDLSYFDQYGNIIDRVYGTAMTLGYKEIGEYTLTLKEVCYMCGQSENKRGHEKVVRMMIECIRHLSTIQESIYNKDALKKINLLLNIEKGRAENLKQTVFFGIDRKSCA